MARGSIDIPLVLDSSGVAAGAKDAVRSIDDIADNLNELEREAKRNDALEDSLEDAERQADDTADALGDVARAAKKAGDESGDSITKGFDRSNEAVGSFKQEAVANFAEVASSFDGSMTDIADGLQGTLGGAGAAIATLPGPVATAAGLAIGIVGAAAGAVLATATEDAERMAEATTEAFQTMASEGIEAWKSMESQNQRLSDAYANHEGDIKKIANLTGVSFETVAAAWAGNEDAIGLVNSAYGDMKAELRDIPGASIDAQQATIRGWDAAMGPLNSTIDGYQKAEDKATRYWNQLAEQTDEGTHQIRTHRDAVNELPGTVSTNVTVTTPDMGIVRRRMQSDADAGRIKIRASIITKYGQEIV